jgi:hypothetical protein
MKAHKVIQTSEERDQLLISWYKDREFWIFWRGQDYFDNEVRKIHDKWINGDLPAGDKWGNDMMIEQSCWEMDNGYLD